MTNLPWKPWHEVVDLRDDLKSGDLSMSMFAADLDDVVRGQAKPVYQNPEDFFALTYPTFNLRELVKEVVLRLAGRSNRAVRQLELTYGGGKTHALIALYHLVEASGNLPDLPAVDEFCEHIGQQPPEARVATLTFDKLDAERGMLVVDPDGNRARFDFPWSVMAYQLAGEKGLKALGMDGREERETPPAENVVREILELPLEDELAPLILIDEVLMWARTKAGENPVWRSRLQDFFQCLTQAATKIDRCAIVASLLSSDPAADDSLDKQIKRELYTIFRREREEAVQPVVKGDVAEILRRRFFTPESISDQSTFRGPVMSALKGITTLDEDTRRNKKSAEERYLKSYPFHPDLTDVFYTKWTQLQGFQRTRGILRTFALALREAEKWDENPLVGVNVFLNAPDSNDLAAGAQELTNIAATEEYEGRTHDWNAILPGELEKARDVQNEHSGLRHREIEQAVMATFLHSQPIGQKAKTQELMVLLGGSRPDKIELQQGLKGWVDRSWFLDESTVGETGPDELPSNWRLGSKPNLRQIHHEARRNVPEDVVQTRMIDTINDENSLTTGAAAAGATVHKLPNHPKDIQDDGQFHYAILGPSAASKSGNPSDVACRFLDETTRPDRPRVYRNSVVLAVPSHGGLDAVRNAVRDFLAWENVREEMKDTDIDPVRKQMLTDNRRRSKRHISDMIKQAYCIVVTVSEENEAEAFRVKVDEEPLFTAIKNDRRSRIKDSAVNAEALLPGGPYDLWQEGETSRRFQDLSGAFAQQPHLPKMLQNDEIMQTLIQGAVDGLFVLKMERPDGSVRTFWMEEPDEAAKTDPGLEVVLSEEAELVTIPPRLLEPGVLPELWEEQQLKLADIEEYFSGDNVVQVKRHGYEEPMQIPAASEEAIKESTRSAVESADLWLISGSASFCGDEVPEDILTEDATLQPPPPPIPSSDLKPENLPEAWDNEKTTADALSKALSEKLGKPLPWGTVREAIQNAIRSRVIELTHDSGPWPCEYEGAPQVKLQIPESKPGGQGGGGGTPPPPPQPSGRLTAESELTTAQIQDLADAVGELKKAAAGEDLHLTFRVEVGGDEDKPSEEVIRKINEILHVISDSLELR